MKKIYLFMLTSALLLNGCRVYNKIYSDYDKSADFTKYKTFAWLPDEDTSNSPYNNLIIRNNTINYFSHCMGERGMKANIDTPDVLLQLIVKSEQKEKHVANSPIMNAGYITNPFYSPFPNTYFYRKPYSHHYAYGCTVYKYSENAITLNVIDKLQNKIVWSGTATADLFDSSHIMDNLHPAVFDILKSYPVKSIYKHNKPHK